MWFMIIETRNLTLEETAVLFDGEEVTQRIAQTGVRGVHTDDFIDEKGSA